MCKICNVKFDLLKKKHLKHVSLDVEREENLDSNAHEA